MADITSGPLRVAHIAERHAIPILAVTIAAGVVVYAARHGVTVPYVLAGLHMAGGSKSPNYYATATGTPTYVNQQAGTGYVDTTMLNNARDQLRLQLEREIQLASAGRVDWFGSYQVGVGTPGDPGYDGIGVSETHDTGLPLGQH